jgi:hypothetical protein
MSAYSWKYLPTGRVRHALSTVVPNVVAAECGVWTFGWWYGTGSQDEYDKLDALPPCKRCAAKVGLAATGNAVPSGIRRTAGDR